MGIWERTRECRDTGCQRGEPEDEMHAGKPEGPTGNEKPPAGMAGAVGERWHGPGRQAFQSEPIREAAFWKPISGSLSTVDNPPA